jgi:hypothetical protein
MKKTDLYLKPGTYIKASTTQGEVQGTSLENFVVSVLNNPTCCPKPVFIKDGMLMTATYLNTSLQTVTDQGPNSSPLKLSTLLVRVESALEIAERLRLEADSTVTTQTSSVIQATTTNASLVIAPNGTGALVASVPDGTATGGNARGANAVDLQQSRSGAGQVAFSNYSFVGGGQNNSTASGDHYQVVVGGLSNSINASGHSFIGGGQSNSIATGSGSGWSVVTGGRSNVASSQYATVSGGQSNTNSSYGGFIGGGFSNAASNNFQTISGGESNTASTNTHATVVGGTTNTSSGIGSTSGGSANIASGQSSVSFGNSNQATARFSTALGLNSKAYLYNQLSVGAVGSSFGFVNGSSQYSSLVASAQKALTTGNTASVTLDGDEGNLIIPTGNNRMWNVQVRWVAVVTAITGTATGVTVGDTKTSTDLLAVARRSGTTTVSAHTSAGTHSIETVAGSLTAANIAYTAGASQEMAITFTGPTFAGGGSVTMRVVAAISLTEVAY